MPCPECGSRTDVYDSRLNTQKLIRRRRGCRACGFRFATIEVMNVYQPLGKKERPDAPIPEPPKRSTPSPKPRASSGAVAKKRAPKEEPVRSFADDIVPWNEDDEEDFSSYIDLPKGFEYD